MHVSYRVVPNIKWIVKRRVLYFLFKKKIIFIFILLTAQIYVIFFQIADLTAVFGQFKF